MGFLRVEEVSLAASPNHGLGKHYGPIEDTDHRLRPRILGWRGCGTIEQMSVREHVDGWLSAWNAHDIEAIVACYASDIEFVVSTAVQRWDRADGRLCGRDELRAHFSRGLELAPDLRFTEEALLVAPDGYALLYRRDNGNRALDAVELDADGLARRVHAYYENPQA
jgi:ketosteroid isomerase-like protein